MGSDHLVESTEYQVCFLGTMMVALESGTYMQPKCPLPSGSYGSPNPADTFHHLGKT